MRHTAVRFSVWQQINSSLLSDSSCKDDITTLADLQFVILQAPSSDSDPDLQAKQQAVLLSAAMRTMAMPLGRGALTLGLTQPLPGEHLAVPLLCLSGIVPGPRGDADATGGRMLISLDLQAAQAAPGTFGF